MENGTYVQRNMTGNFSKYNEDAAELYDKMTVFYGQTEVDEEILEYLSEDKKCAVVAVSNQTISSSSSSVGGALTFHDLRVEDTALNDINNTKYDECRKRYNDILLLTKKNWTQPYTPECKSENNGVPMIS
ncbi:uncharacterized protein LOC119373387 isoform X2 [Rhipicephalus sanguineus]|nr:uncharacterized protein LOC119373387 isoform X2 [Rhipicephalus sanguineus]